MPWRDFLYVVGLFRQHPCCACAHCMLQLAWLCCFITLLCGPAGEVKSWWSTYFMLALVPPASLKYRGAQAVGWRMRVDGVGLTHLPRAGAAAVSQRALWRALLLGVGSFLPVLHLKQKRNLFCGLGRVLAFQGRLGLCIWHPTRVWLQKAYARSSLAVYCVFARSCTYVWDFRTGYYLRSVQC